jgi:hypothetical protein
VSREKKPSRSIFADIFLAEGREISKFWLSKGYGKGKTMRWG